MIGAIKQPNGKYTLIDIKYDFPLKTTFGHKDKIKSFGAIWDNNKKHWIDFPEDKLKEIGASKRLKIKIAPYNGYGCEDKSSDCFTYEYQIINNTIKKMDWGDSWATVKIEEIYGEE